MNVQTNELTRSAQGVSSCGFCSQPWFGSVAYCPYCGKPGLASAKRPGDARRDAKAAAGDKGNFGTPTGTLPWRDDEPSHRESRRKPLAGLPAFDKELPAGQDSAASPPINRTVLALLFIAAAAVGALLLWMVFKLAAPKPDTGAPPQPPISASETPPPAPGPSTDAAPVPSTPAPTGAALPPPTPARRAETAAPPPTPAPRAETAIPPPSNSGALCSPASEAAGLCKSQ